MRARLERWALRFDALALRERAMIFAGSAVVLIFLANVLIIERLTANAHRLNALISSQSSVLTTTEYQVKALQQALGVDLDAANRERLLLAQQQLSQLESQFSTAQKSLVSAELMPALLQDVLRQHQGLKLVELRTLPVMALTGPAAAKAAGGESVTAVADDNTVGREHNLYKHGFELTVQGSYPDFVQYLSQLERLPKHMYWGKVVMNADEYPRVTLTATIYTLSLDKAWLSV
jgi:MSHA biogenesis protein MshJ